jgi:hypothetical protein
VKEAMSDIAIGRDLERLHVAKCAELGSRIEREGRRMGSRLDLSV